MLTVRGLSRVYGDARVVDEVSFDVRPGRLTGFVGANGAGKTTTMRMLIGVLAPSAGEVLWNGEPITTGQRRSFGYMPEERGLLGHFGLDDRRDGLPGADVDHCDGDAALVTITSGDPADLLSHLISKTRVSDFHRHVEPLAHVFREATR